MPVNEGWKRTLFFRMMLACCLLWASTSVVGSSDRYGYLIPEPQVWKLQYEIFVFHLLPPHPERPLIDYEEFNSLPIVIAHDVFATS